jgi:hypothetical protein
VILSANLAEKYGCTPVIMCSEFTVKHSKPQNFIHYAFRNYTVVDMRNALYVVDCVEAGGSASPLFTNLGKFNRIHNPPLVPPTAVPVIPNC